MISERALTSTTVEASGGWSDDAFAPAALRAICERRVSAYQLEHAVRALLLAYLLLRAVSAAAIPPPLCFVIFIASSQGSVPCTKPSVLSDEE